jgi:hypothetical protein
LLVCDEERRRWWWWWWWWSARFWHAKLFLSVEIHPWMV